MKLAATTSAIERELVRGPHVSHYRTDDELKGEEGAFFACSFWLAGSWALQGRTSKVRDLVVFANDLGLFSEEMDPTTGDLLGDLPPSPSHMVLVNALVRLERCIDRYGL